MSAGRKLVFYAMMLGMPLVAALLAIGGYYGMRKLALSHSYCGSYATFDDELGWRLKPNATSCMSLKNHLRGVVYFDTVVAINAGGFRDAKPGGEPPQRAVMAIGDSWTFGYGVNFEEAYPHFLSAALGVPAINAGVPGYGAGSNLLLLERNAARYRPAVVVYHTPGLHARSLCSAREAATTLVPCFHHTAGGIALAVPKPGAVADAVQRNVYPGGSVTAGYASQLRFFLLVRIPEVAGEWGRKAAHLLGADATPEPGFDGAHTAAALEFELRRLQELSRQHGFALVLADPYEFYRSAFAAVFGTDAGRAVYLGQREWADNVESKLAGLTPDAAWVPMDGHYGRGQNRIVGEYLAGVIRERLPEQLREAGAR